MPGHSSPHPGRPFPTAPPGHAPRRVDDLSRLLLGLVVVGVGALYLLDGGDVLDAGRAIDHWWPIVLVAAGVFTLLERPPSVPRGSLLVGIGTVLLLFTTNALE